jgi:imidazolonepropionase-like amidohydrolase
LSKDKALQSVTSVPARSIQQGHRIGYVRPDYDADLVIWDVHPLQVGATPTQVFVDGNPVLDAKVVSDIFTQVNQVDLDSQTAPQARVSISQEQKSDVCDEIQSGSSKIVFTGIHKILMDHSVDSSVEDGKSTGDVVIMVENGRIICVDTHSRCLSVHGQEDITSVDVPNGYITPGLIAFGNDLGILAISAEGSTGDGNTGRKGNALDDQKSLHFAKYGIHLHGRAFTRSRVGGVTKAITAPLSRGFLQGVSVGLRTSENATILSGGIWKDDVAIHFTIGQSGKGSCFRDCPVFHDLEYIVC